MLDRMPAVPLSSDVLAVGNLYGQLGPKCPWCSGLGYLFKPRIAYGESPGSAGQCSSVSRCACKGTGIDQEAIRQQDQDRLLARIAALESHYQQLLESRSTLPQGQCSRQYWMEAIAWQTADGTAVSNTTTETIIFPNVSMPGNYMQDGRALRIRAFGKLSTTGTPTMVWALRWNGVAGTLLATTEAITMGSGVTNVNWSAELMVQTRSNGSSGSLMVFGDLSVHTSNTAVAANVFSVSGYDAPAAVTVDLTADAPLSFTADWSAASSSNTLTGMIYTIESLN